MVINLSKLASAQLECLIQESGLDEKELIQFGLGLVRLIIDEEGKGNTVLITKPDGSPVSRLIVPTSVVK